MHINFAMWRKASWQLIKMDDKKSGMHWMSFPNG